MLPTYLNLAEEYRMASVRESNAINVPHAEALMHVQGQLQRTIIGVAFERVSQVDGKQYFHGIPSVQVQMSQVNLPEVALPNSPPGNPTQCHLP